MVRFMMSRYRIPRFVELSGFSVWRIITSDFSEVDFPDDSTFKKIMRSYFSKGEPEILLRFKGPSNTCVIRIAAGSRPKERAEFMTILENLLVQNAAKAA